MRWVESLQAVLIGKLREVPAEDVDRVREYIKEIMILESEKSS